MTARFIDSFDHYFDPSLKWYAFQNAEILTGVGRFGTNGCALFQNGNNGYLQYYRPNLTTGWATSYENLAIWIVGLAYQQTQSATGALIDFCLMPDISTSQITIGVNSNGTLYASSGSRNLFTTVRQISPNTYYYIEAKAWCDTINGFGGAEIHVNDTTWGSNFTGIDTQPFDDTSYHFINMIQLSGVGQPYIDDVYILAVTGVGPQGIGYNNDFWGDTRIEIMRPISDGTHVDWTPSSGSDAYLMLNANYAQFTSNVSTYPSYQKETNFMDSSIALPGTMNAIQQSVLLKQSSWSEPLIRTSGSDYYLTSGSWRIAWEPDLSPIYGTAVWQVNPATGGAWNDVTLPASEIGFMSTTTSGSF